MKQIDTSTLDALAGQARQSPRLRTNLNLHQELSDPVQRLAIAMQPDTLVLPHRHSATFEILTALRGRFIVLIWDEAGERVVQRTVLGDACRVVEIPPGEWHAVLSLDDGGVIFEVKRGPYLPITPADVLVWAHGRAATELNAWYARAQVGDIFPG